MAKVKRLSRVARDCNVGINTIVEFLSKKGFEIDSSPNSKIPEDALDLVMNEFQQDQTAKREAEKFTQEHRHESRSSAALDESQEKEATPVEEEPEQEDVLLITDKGIGKEIKKEVPKSEPEKEITTKVEKTEEPAKPDAEPIVETEQKPVEAEVKEIITPEPEVKKPATKPKKEKAPEKTEKEEVEEAVEKVEEKVEEKVAEKVEKKVEEKAEEKVEEKVEAKKPSKTEPKEEKPEKEAEVPEKKEKADKDEIFNPNAGKEAGSEIKVVGKIDIDSLNQKTRPSKKSKTKAVKTPEPKPVEEKKAEKVVEKPVKEEPKKETVKPEEKRKAPSAPETMKDYDAAGEVDIKTEIQKLSGPTVVGKIELPKEPVKKKQQPAASSDKPITKKKKRKRIRKDKVDVAGAQKAGFKKPGTAPDARKGKPRPGGKGKRRVVKPEVSEEDVQKQIKDTLARLTTKGKSKGSKHRREKRESIRQTAASEAEKKKRRKLRRRLKRKWKLRNLQKQNLKKRSLRKKLKFRKRRRKLIRMKSSILMQEKRQGQRSK